MILDYNNMMSDAIMGEGFCQKDFADSILVVEKAYAKVCSMRGKGWQEWTELPFMPEKEIAEIEALASVASSADSLVVLGIGGSALGPLAAANALLHLRHNELPRSKRKAPKLYIEDNIDPERMKALLDVIKIKDTVFNVITKSGETSETLSQFLVIYDILKKKLGDSAKDKIVVTTTIGKGTLYSIAKQEGFKILGVGAGVGGRFSVLSSVGLFPLATVGIDIRAILRGAQNMTKSALSADISANPALLSALLQYLSIKRGRNISVMMPYADSLKYMADFYCQLWGESLGKAIDNNGNLVNVGQTPVRALGVTDQHSQIQLYVEGPQDKVVTFIAVDGFRSKVTIPRAEYVSTSFLQRQSMGNLLNYERKATEFALRKAKRPNFTVTLDSVTPESVGELLQYFMYQTAFAGAMLDIDTYNQPGVEEGKKATFAMLKREGYADKLKEFKKVKKSDSYIVKS